MSLAPAPSPQNVKAQVSAAEWQTRVDLAACYRLVSPTAHREAETAKAHRG